MLENMNIQQLDRMTSRECYNDHLLQYNSGAPNHYRMFTDSKQTVDITVQINAEHPNRKKRSAFSKYKKNSTTNVIPLLTKSKCGTLKKYDANNKYRKQGYPVFCPCDGVERDICKNNGLKRSHRDKIKDKIGNSISETSAPASNNTLSQDNSDIPLDLTTTTSKENKFTDTPCDGLWLKSPKKSLHLTHSGKQSRSALKVTDPKWSNKSTTLKKKGSNWKCFSGVGPCCKDFNFNMEPRTLQLVQHSSRTRTAQIR